MYGIPGIPTDNLLQKASGSNIIGTLLRYSFITTSNSAWAKQADTTCIVVCGAGGGGGGGGGSRGGTPADGFQGSPGGDTSFGTYIFYSVKGSG